MTTPTTPAVRGISAGVRGELLRGLLTTVVCLGIIIPVALLDRPPTSPRLTFLGADDGMSLLLEGAGGGRVLIGGGGTQSDLPAALGRQWWPWNRRLDLLIIVDARDLPGATELVRRGGVQAVATVGVVTDRGAASATAALQAACTARGVPIRAIDEAEQIVIGRDASFRLDLDPLATPDAAPNVRLSTGSISMSIVVTGGQGSGSNVGAVVLHGGQEAYQDALRVSPHLIIAPAPPTTTPAGLATDIRLLVVGPGERSSLTVEGAQLRLRGGVVTRLDGSP